MPSCARCGDTQIAATITVIRGADLGTLNLCVWCSFGFDQFLAMNVEHVELIDDARHHVSCRCPECDPDTQLEIVRDLALDRRDRLAS